MNIQITTSAGTTDITQLVKTVSWSGDYKQCARTLDFGLLSSVTDKNIPVIPCPLGAGISLSHDGKERFSGHIFTRQKSTEGSIIDLTAIDGGLYVKRNKASYNFTKMTPEAITKRVCSDFGITVGELAATGVILDRNFVTVTLYQIIQTVYTLASEQTGEQYQIRFEGAALSVVEKGVNSETVVITGGSNLMTATVTESIEKLINQVQVVDKSGKVISSKGDSELISLYGLLQEQISQNDKDDMAAKVDKLLADNGATQKITLNNLGDVRCITGNSVVVREPYTGLYGLFYIDSDTHTWKNGLYLNKLVVNYRRIMDEQEAGSVDS